MKTDKMKKLIVLTLLAAMLLSLAGCVKIGLPELPEFAPPTPTPIVTPKPTPAPSLLPLPSDYYSPTPAATAPAESQTPAVSAKAQNGSVETEALTNSGSSKGTESKPASASAKTVSPAAESQITQVSAPSVTYYDTPVISISGETLPSDMTQGNVCDLRGTLNTSCGIFISIYAALLDEYGNPAQECSYYGGSSKFSLAGTVNASLGFSVLSPGQYTYYLAATAQNGDITVETKLIDHSFTVKPISSSGGKTGASSSVSGAESSGANSGSTDPGAASFKYTDDTSTAGVIWNYFAGALGNSHAAAAILANINAESSCVPIRVQSDFSSGYSVSQDYTGKVDRGEISRSSFADGSPGKSYGNGYGLCQWSYERKGALYDFAQERGTSVGDLETQCAFIIHELENDYPKLLSYLKTTTDTSEATLEFCNVYEQAGTKTGRTAMAKEFYDRYA